ncbi:MAG: tyrosine-type recombinase/integrase [Roseovarius sp.]
MKRLAHPGGGRGIVSYTVGGVPGLMLAITPGGGRSWVLRVVVGGVRRKIGLGSYPAVTLAEARERAREARAQIVAGVDPVAERRAAQAALRAAQKRLSFAEALAAYHDEKAHEFKSAKHQKQWRSETERLVGEELGPMRVDQIGTQDVLRALRPHWHERTDTARRVRGRIESVLDWAVVAGHRPAGDNPARWKGNLALLLPAPRKVAQSGNQPAVALDDLPRWWADLAERDGMAAQALRFLTLTAARSGEVRGATWDEIDLDKNVWTVPAGRMKASRDHRVPLPDEAVALLRDLPRMAGSEFVFPAPRGGALSDMSISAVMRRLHEAAVKRGNTGYLDRASKRPAVPHGLRSSFRDWAAERTNWPGEMAELALAHKISNAVEAAYRRGDQFEKRRRMMTDWAAFLRGEEAARVIPLRGAAQ